VGDAHSVALVILDVLGPGPALNVKQLPVVRVGELDGHQGALVVGLLFVGEVVGGEPAGLREIVDLTHSFFVGGILTAAVDPDLKSIIFKKTSLSTMKGRNKLACLSLARFSSYPSGSTEMCFYLGQYPGLIHKSQTRL